MEEKREYQKELKQIQEAVIAMSGMVDNAIARSIEALKKRDLNLAHKVISEDAGINKQRFAIEDQCVLLMENQHIVADDLRFIIAVLNMISELERIGDYAEGIAKVAVLIGDEPPLKPLIDIPRMAEFVSEMIRDSVRSFFTRDVNLAMKVISLDDNVDALNDQIYRELLTFMMVDPKTITRATRLIWVGHNLERAADRTTNICERVVYMVKGKMEELGTSKY